MNTTTICLIAAILTIGLLAGTKNSCKRDYIIFSRIDLHVEVPVVPFKELSASVKASRHQPSASECYVPARCRRNASATTRASTAAPDPKGRLLSERHLHLYAEPDAKSLDILRMAMDRFKLSARAYSRILRSTYGRLLPKGRKKVARVIADLAGSEKVEAMHIAEAIGYRNLDRGDWAERDF